MLVEALERICADHCTKDALDAAERGEFPYALWRVLVDNGFHDLGLPDAEITDADLYAVLRAAARHALPIPLAEAVLGKRWLAAAGIDSNDDLVSVGLLCDDAVVHIPWGRQAQSVLAVLPRDFSGQPEAAASSLAICDSQSKAHGDNLAGEPRDALLHVEYSTKLDQPNAYDELALSLIHI